MAAFTSGQIAALNTTAKGICLNKIIQVLIDLDLEDVTTKWYFMRQPWVSEIGSYPCGVVSEFRGSMNDREGVIGLSDTHFRYIVALARAANFDHQNNAELMFEWDEAIRRAFRKLHPDWLTAEAGIRMAGVTITEGESFLDEAFRKQADAMYFLVDVHVRET